jgi:ABC-type multidrug transport system fused ATPase/permease subunit
MFSLGAVLPFLAFLTKPDLAGVPEVFVRVLSFLGHYLGGGPLLAASWLFACTAALAALLRLLLSWISARFVYMVGADFGEKIYHRILSQPYHFHLQRNSSEIISGIGKITPLVMCVLAPAMQLVIAAVMALAILIGILLINVKVALLAGIAFGGMYFLINKWAKNKLQGNGGIISAAETQKIKIIQEGVGSIRDVILDGNHSVYVNAFSQSDRWLRHAQAVNSFLAIAPKYVVESVGMIMMVVLGYNLTKNQDPTMQAIPLLGALALGAQRLLPYLQNIYNSLACIQGSLAIATDVMYFLKLPIHEESMKSDANDLGEHGFPRSGSLVELKGVEFSYADKLPKIIKSVDLQINRGQRIGFVGATGSGKSTLIDLIMCLLNPTSGVIRVDGMEINESNRPAWRRRVAHVPQAIFLTDSSIAENIALGVAKAEIDMSRLMAAVEQAQLTDVVRQLPRGLDTRVGERGVQLSGGQRQRIGIARALYKSADMLVLDEATSALDSDTESKVMDAIYQLNPEMVILMIAHRTSTLERCDLIYQIIDGDLKLIKQNEEESL